MKLLGFLFVMLVAALIIDNDNFGAAVVLAIFLDIIYLIFRLLYRLVIRKTAPPVQPPPPAEPTSVHAVCHTAATGAAAPAAAPARVADDNLGSESADVNADSAVAPDTADFKYTEKDKKV